MIADIEANNKLSPVVTELFLREREPNILLLHHNIICLLQSVWNYKTKHNTWFYQENAKQKWTSLNSIESFVWNWI